MAFKCLHNDTREKNDFSLELTLQTLFTILFTWVIQFGIVGITIGDFYN